MLIDGEMVWVLIDLDGIDRPLYRSDHVDQFNRSVGDIARHDCWLSGSHAVVRTSNSGVQVWLRLAESVDPDRFSASATVRSWLRGIGSTLCTVLDKLGLGIAKVDDSAFGSHRYGRRPGWRVKNGNPERATLLCAVDG